MKPFSYSLFIFACFLIGCTKPESREPSPAVVVDVRVSQIRLGSLDESVTATGTTTSQRESQLRSPINGIITRFQFFNGDAVKKGDTVACIQTKESKASIQGAEKLLRGAATPAQREEAQKALRLAEQSANDAIVPAPFDGILSNKAKNEMEAIAEGEAFASVIDPRSIVFIADVPSRFLSQVRKNQEARIRFPSMPKNVFSGTVSRIDPQVNPNDQTTRVQVNFTQPNRNFERSLFGDATIIVGRKSNVLLAPAAALLHNDENNTTNIVVVGKDSIAHRIEVQVGIRQDSVAQIISPAVNPGDLVIVQGHYGLPDSMRVRIVQ